MVDREEAIRFVGKKVAVRLNTVEARGVEIVATLEEVRDDGIVLSGVGELGPGPTMFCPWGSLRRVRDRPPWLRPPHEEPDEQETYDLRCISPPPPEEAAVPEPPVGRRRSPSARTLERVVPIAQKQTVGGITVALTSLELHGEGLGVLWWRISFEEELLAGSGLGIPEPEFMIRSGSGRELPWWRRGSGASDREADGEIEVEELPESGELEVEVSRLVFREWSSALDDEEEVDSYEGPWSFRFSL